MPKPQKTKKKSAKKKTASKQRVVKVDGIKMTADAARSYSNMEDGGDAEHFTPEEVKVRITTFIDSDVLTELKSIAKERSIGSKKVGYQTVLNEILRRSLFEEKSLAERVKALEIKVSSLG